MFETIFCNLFCNYKHLDVDRYSLVPFINSPRVFTSYNISCGCESGEKEVKKIF